MEQVRVFASNYQIYVHDFDYNHHGDDRLDWLSAEAKKYGYISTEMAIYIKTVAHLNDHRVRVFINQDVTSNYEQTFKGCIFIPSGKLIISAPVNDEDDDLILTLQAGIYSVCICGNAIGDDMFST